MVSQSPDIAAAPEVSASPSTRTLGRTFRRYPLAVIASVVLILMVFIAIFAPFLWTIDPLTIDPIGKLKAPNALHWFGTDMYGRDIYSRTLYGARVSLTVGFTVAIVASVVGIAAGLVCGFYRWVDAVLMRLMDALMSIPPVLLAIALMALTSASTQNVVIAISIAEFPRVARLVRGVALSLREQAFVDAAITSGSTTGTIIWKHILPNIVAPIIVQASYICASAMIVEAVLSFIGAGTPPSIPSWGNMMAEARTLWQVKPYTIFLPATFLSLTVLAVNLLGDGIRDALDPRTQKNL